MTTIEFHHNAANRTVAACQLIAARVARGQRVWVVATDEVQAEQLDRTLWSFEALSFVPHCREGAATQAQTPVIIARQPASPAGDWVLMNFSDHAPDNFEQFDTLIEVVGRDTADREAARARFKLYRERGCALTTHDLNEAGSHG